MFKFSSLILLCILLKVKKISLNLSLIKKSHKNSKFKDKDVNSYKSNDNSFLMLKQYSNLKRKLTQIKKNLILCSVLNYKWEVVQPFFKSFESVGFENCDCIVFVSRISNSTLNKIKSCGAIVINIPKEYENMNVNKMRWKMYFDYVINNIDKYNLVLATDSRDAFFQRDLFQFYDSKKSFLGVALEEDYLSERVLKIWITYAFGKEVFKKIKNKRMICAGTILGTVDKFIQFAYNIWEKVKNDSFNLKLHDQAVTNYIIYIEKKFDDCLKKSEYKDGYIITLGLVRNNITLDNENNILNEDGEIAALVHQYDRKKDIQKIVRKKYCVEGKVYINKKKFINLKSFTFFLLLILMIIIILIIKIFFRFKYTIIPKRNLNN